MAGTYPPADGMLKRMSTVVEAYDVYLQTRKQQGLYRTLPLEIQAGLSFDHNDTLGLSKHPALIEATQAYAHEYGVSSSGSRLLCSNQALYQTIEHQIAQLNQRESALIFASGFQANVSVIAALMDRQVLKQQAIAFTDKCIHASMQLGCQLARCHQVRFRHQDLKHLEQRLLCYKNDPRPKFILIESLYGMEGTVSNLKQISELANAYQAFLYVDEAHAFGVYGPQGGGFSANHPSVDLVLGTFSKALGSFGGFITCSAPVKDYLINRCQGLIYTTGLPPSVLGAQQAALDLLPRLNQKRQHLHQLSQWWSQQTQHFFHCAQDAHISVIEINHEKAQSIHQQLRNEGIHVSLIRPPTAATTRLRISLNSDHTQDSLSRLLKLLKQFL